MCVHACVGIRGYMGAQMNICKCLCLLGDSQSYEAVTPCQFLGFSCESVCACVHACMHGQACVWVYVDIWGHRSTYVSACVGGGGGVITSSILRHHHHIKV